jgi:hypothetical protein
MLNKIVLFKITVLLFYLFTNCSSTKKISEYDITMLKACEFYTDNYEPLHYLEEDTSILGVFNYIPDSINNYLIECAKNNDFRALKYSYAIILRQAKEIEGICTSQLVEDYVEFQPNGFVDLFVKAMGIEKGSEVRIYSDALFFLDFYEWAEKNKKKIDDFNYVRKYKRKLKRLSSVNNALI